jgi:hypothetical protein
VVLDLFSRRVVGWAMESHLGHQLALAALDMAIARQRPAPGLTHHSEPPRVCRRPYLLRGWGHDKEDVEPVFA